MYELSDELIVNGLDVETIPTNNLNRVTVAMYDKIIYTCDIRNLKFNMDCQDDPVCQKAVKTILGDISDIF